MRGKKAHYVANVNAIKVLKRLEAEGRLLRPTVEEQAALSLYAGWGGLAEAFDEKNEAWADEYAELKGLLSETEYNAARRGTQYAHYTPIPVIRGIYDALVQGVGLKGSGLTAYEAGVGVGHFIGALPEGLRGTQYVGVDVDPMTAKIAQALYPHAKISNIGFQSVKLDDGSVDFVVGNPPFSDTKLTDVDKRYAGMSMHNHFIAKQIDALKPGGVAAFVVSRYFMDGKRMDTREYIHKRAAFLGAVRLPGETFAGIAGTKVVTDIVFFRKRLDGEAVPKRGETGAEWLDVMPWQAKDVNGNAFGSSATVNKWFSNRVEQKVLGRMRVGEHGRYGGGSLEVDAIGDVAGERGIVALRGEIAQAAGEMLKQAGKPFDPQTRRGNGATDGLDAAAQAEIAGKLIGGFDHPSVMAGSYFNGSDGKLYAKRLNSVGDVVAVAVREDFTSDELKQEKASFSGKGAFRRWYHVKDAHLRLTAQEGRIVRAINDLRNIRYDLAALEQQEGASDDLLKQKRTALNSAYQAFLKAAEGYGNNSQRGSKVTYLSDSAIAQLMENDPAFSQVIGLEFPKRAAKVEGEAADGQRAVRAGTIIGMTLSPIFERRVSKPKAELKTHYDDVNEAMLASLGMRGKIDLDWMTQVTGKSEEAVLDELGERAFINPNNGALEIGAHYLSGDVKTKLEDARRADGGSGRFERNIQALEKVIPKDIPAEELLVSINSPYVPQTQVERFFRGALGIDHVRAFYAKESGKWIVSMAGYLNNRDAELIKMLSGVRIGVEKFLQAVMDGTPPRIYKSIGDGKFELDSAATDSAREQYERVREMWEGWWKSDAKAVREISAAYNERVNRYADPVYDGSFLRFDGLNSVYTLNKHQRDAVARTVMTGRTLFNHVVGSGKTLTTICSIMEMRRMGLVNKPIVAVPNQITEQWRQDFLKAYPAANVLCASEDEMKDSNRRKALYSRIQNGDYDAIILPHSMLSRLPLSPQMEEFYLEKQIASFRAAISEIAVNSTNKRTIKNIEARVQKFEERLKKLREAPQDNTGLYFDTLGFDGFFLDEAHIFKNVPFVCSQQVAGMGNPSGSKQALDLMMKMDYMREFKAGSPTVFMTGTPISNSLTEIYTNMRLMAPDLLENAGIKTMDNFLNQFCEMTEEAEFDATGQMKIRKRLRRVVNAGDLMTMIRSYMDVVQYDDLERSMAAVGKRYNVPQVEGGGPQTVVAKRSPEQEEYFGKPAKMGQAREREGIVAGTIVTNIISRAEDVRARRVDKRIDNMLKITSNAKAASLDMRLLFPNAPDFAGSKVNLCVGEVMKVYRDYADVKGTQIIWCDLSTPKSSMGDVKKELGARREFLKKLEEAAKKAEAEGKSIFEVDSVGEKDADGNSVNEGESLGEQIDRVRGDISALETKITSGFSVYDDIKEKLVSQGVKPSEVAFVHDYDTKAKKAMLNEKMNRGEIRVLIGSTGKMGTGMNVQERLVAMHHLDCPWKPAELEQRNGRIIRQGNKLYDADPEHFRVKIKNYVTEATNDAAMYQTILNKQISLNSLYKADRFTRSVEDVWTPQARSAEEMMAEASGSKLLPLRAQMGKQTNELRRKRDSFDAKRVRLESGVDENETELDALERSFEQEQQLHDMAQEKPDNSKNKYAGFELLFRNEAPKTFEFKTFKERVQQAQPLVDLLRGMRDEGRVRYRGMTAKIATRASGELFDQNNNAERYKMDYRFEFLGNDGKALGYSSWTQYPENSLSIDENFFGKLNRAIDGFIGEKWEETKSKREKQIDDTRKTITLQKGELEKMPKENPYAAEYEQLSKEFEDLMAVTNANAVNAVEAQEMLRKKYEEAGKPVPEYSWASPSEKEVAQYQREIEAENAKNAPAPGMLREPAYERIVRERLKMRGIDESQLPQDEKAVLAAYRAHQEAMPKGVVGKAKDGLKQFNERLPGETTEAWRSRKLQEAKDWLATVAVDATTPLRRAVEQITGGRKLDDDEDIAKAMQLSYGKVAERHREIEQQYTSKIMHILAKNGLDVPTLDVYLTAKFAPERNAMILERAEWKDAGSGMTDETAEAQLRGLKDTLGDAKFAELERAAEVVYQMNRDNLDGMADAGVLSRDQVAEWKRLSPHYVPLREDMSRLGLDDVQGTSLAGEPYKRAVGRFTEMTSSTLGWSILQAMQGVILQEQNYINNVALNFCKQNASDEDYRISVLPKRVERVFKTKGVLGFSMDRAVPLMESRASDKQIIDAMEKQGYTVVREGNGSDIAWVDSRELDAKMAVRKMPDYSKARNRQTVVARVNGRRVYILFNPQVGSRGNKMGMAITKANVHHWDNQVWNMVVGATRIKAAMSTIFSPTFAVRNAVADLANTIAIMSTEMKGKELGRVLKNYGGALSEYAKFRKGGQFNDNTLLGRYLKEAMQEGLLTGIYANSTYEKNMAEHVLKPFKEMQHRIGMEQNAFSLDTLAYGWDKLKSGTQIFSEIPEVGIRLAVYSAMRESGMSISDATVYAREITVDFNKKGTVTPITNVLYMFSNAGIQAMARYLKAAKTGGAKGALLGAMLFTSIGFFGRLWNRMLVEALFGGGGDDDDEAWKNIPDYISDRGLPIVLPGGKYLEVPTRGIQSAFILMGQKLYDIAIAKDVDPATAVYDIVRGPLAENINFVGNSGSFWQAVSPTALDPVVQLIENKSWTGQRLHSLDYGNSSAPKYGYARKHTSPAYVWLSKFFSDMSGGDEVEGGALNVYPEELALVGQFFTGTVGVDIEKLGSFVSGNFSTQNVPILRGFVRPIPDNTNRYFNAKTDFNAKLKNYKSYLNIDKARADKYYEDNPILRNAEPLKNLQREIERLTKVKARMAANGIEDERVNEAILSVRRKFMEFYEAGKMSK